MNAQKYKSRCKTPRANVNLLKANNYSVTQMVNRTKYCAKMKKNCQNSGAGRIEDGEITLKTVNNYVVGRVSLYRDVNRTNL